MEGPWRPKITKNRLKIVAERFLGGFMISWPIREGSGRLRGQFREGFERLLGRLLEHLKTFWLLKKERIWTNMRGAFQVEGLAMMIRATSSRSRRPNHLREFVSANERHPESVRTVPWLRAAENVARSAGCAAEYQIDGFCLGRICGGCPQDSPSAVNSV